MKTNNNEAWVNVFSSSPFEAEIIKGMLETNGIPCIVEDHTSVITSYYNNVEGDMRILVAPENKDLALKLIEHKG